MSETLHLIKLCVGMDSLEALIAWRDAHPSGLAKGHHRHVTRMWPKRADELLRGGSLYWVIRGVVRARQRIVSLDEVIGQDGIRRCGIVMDPEIHKTVPAPRRAFQGWRYLTAADAPPDLGTTDKGYAELPPDLADALADIGVR